MSISKNKIKLINSLGDKKNRDESGLYIAEGEKIVSEILQTKHTVEILVAREPWLKKHEAILSEVKEVYGVDESIIGKISNLSTPGDVIAIVRKHKSEVYYNTLHSQLSLVLDDIQDPGNLGTILRIADWFGLPNVICSENTVDVYNPKVIQSSMGAFLRIKHMHCNLEGFFKETVTPDMDIYGAFLDGKNIYSEKLKTTGIIVMGNESKGIHPKLAKYINRRITIPGYPPQQQGAESLNVSVATGIICAEFRRLQN